MGSCCQCESPQPQAQKNDLARDWFVFGLLAILAGVSMSISLALNLSPPDGNIRTTLHGILALLTLTALVFFARPIFKRAARFRITLESLFLIGLVGAFAASVYSSATGLGHIYYEVTLILLAIYRLGQLVSARHVSKARDLTRSIPGMAGRARRIYKGREITVPVEEIAKGDIVRVSSGETIPVDGAMSEGRAYIEQLPHTGEPYPVPKHPGDSVLAGTLVLDGNIEVVATCSGKTREIDRLSESLKTGRQSEMEELAQSILRFFVPAVVMISILTLLGWGLIAGDWQAAIFHALAVTIVACPCGLGLAIPLTVRNGGFQLRLLGITPRRGDLLDRLSQVDTIVFDKTGTLTESNLSLVEFEAGEDAPAELASWLAEIQRHSTHPVARPFWDLAKPVGLEKLSIQVLPARGIESTFTASGNDQKLVIANQLYLEELLGRLAADETRRLEILLNDKPVAHAVLGEDPRENTKESLKSLRRSGAGIEIMTGDDSVDPIFSGLADATHTSLSTQEKGELIQELQNSGKSVLYVGDGLNDSEAMQKATASLSIGSGSGVASEVAHGRLDPPDLSVIHRAINFSKNVRRRLHSLLSFVLIYNAIGIALAASGWLHPVVAAFLMLASSITVLSCVSVTHEQVTAKVPVKR